MLDLIIALIVAAMLGGAITYIIKEKKKGTRCIGCPAAGACSRNPANGGCGCEEEHI